MKERKYSIQDFENRLEDYIPDSYAKTYTKSDISTIVAKALAEFLEY